MGENAKLLPRNIAKANKIFRVSYYHYLFLYKINKIIQSDSLSCCWRIVSVLVAFVTRRIARRRENSSFFPQQTFLRPTRKRERRKVSSQLATPTDRPTPSSARLKFISLQNKIKLYCPPFCVRYEISKEKNPANSFIRFGFCAFLCMSASNLFLSSDCELFFPDVKREKSFTLITFAFTTKAFETPLSFEVSNQRRGGLEQLNTHFNELSSTFFLSFLFTKMSHASWIRFFYFNFIAHKSFLFIYLFISKVLSRILYSIFSFLSLSPRTLEFFFSLLK